MCASANRPQDGDVELTHNHKRVLNLTKPLLCKTLLHLGRREPALSFLTQPALEANGSQEPPLTLNQPQRSQPSP